VIQGGPDAGARALLGALNKLNDRNFDAIRDRVIALVDGGAVDGGQAARAVIVKSCDDASYAPVFARLLAALAACLSPPSTAEADTAAAAAATAAATSSEENVPRRGGGTEAIAETLAHVTTLYCDGGEALRVAVVEVARAIEAPNATPEKGYDAFCAALRGKRRMLGRTSTALAVLALMARELSQHAQSTQQPFPRPLDVATAVVYAVRGGVRSGSEAEIDVALDVAAQLVASLGRSTVASHVAAVAALRDGIRDALGGPEASAMTTKVRFKVQDLLQAPGSPVVRAVAAPVMRVTPVTRVTPGSRLANVSSTMAQDAVSAAEAGWKSAPAGARRHHGASGGRRGGGGGR
jgi:hypothetical protein